jgi:hypothetical protein
LYTEISRVAEYPPGADKKSALLSLVLCPPEKLQITKDWTRGQKIRGQKDKSKLDRQSDIGEK